VIAAHLDPSFRQSASTRWRLGHTRGLGRSGEVWKLYAGDDLAADLVVTGGDFPWLDARVDARPALESLRPLLDEEWAATESEDWKRAERLYRAVNDAARLVDPQGVAVAEFLLHLQGDRAWWRWSAEPFEDRG
jgi:hypothetical protein